MFFISLLKGKLGSLSIDIRSKTYILKAESTQEFQKWREVLKKNGALWMDDLWTNETQQSTSPNQTQQSQTQNPNRFERITSFNSIEQILLLQTHQMHNEDR